MNLPSNRNPALNGEVTFDGDKARLFFQRRLPHPSEKVWAALTDPAELRQWFMASSVKLTPGAGGSLEMVAGPAQIHSQGRILVWDPPRVYEYEWITGPRAEIPNGEDSIVRWELQAVGAETLLTLTHSRLTRPTALGFGPGLHVFLDRLAAQLSAVPIPDWHQRFSEVSGSYPGWER